MKILHLSILLILINTLSFGQVISGIVSDKKELNPIPFANLLVEGTHIGTVSNEEGRFELSLKELNDEFTLIVSVIGYKTVKVHSSSTTTNSVINIQLEENVMELEEVVVTHISTSEILDKFHKNYTSNYYQGSTLHRGFYHSTLSENNNHKHLLEATINVREFTKRKKRKFEVQITQRRKSNDYRKEKWAEKNNYLFDAIGSNPMLELSDFLDKKNEAKYNIKRLDNTSYNNEVVYVLHFIPKKEINKPLYEAKAYFSSYDFALIKCEYNFENHEQKIKNQSLKDRTYHISFISGSVQYQKIGEFYTQKHLSYNNGWTIINNITNDTLAKDILRDEILFSECENDNNTPLPNPLTKWGDIYKKPFPYDSKYWKNQTKIPLSQTFQKAIKDLGEQQNIEIQYFNNSANAILAQKISNTPNDKIDSILSVYHFTKLFNGVALITNNNRVIHHKAYGYQNEENGIMLDTSTVFDIGSITKQFTTAIILKLREDGKLRLDDKIGKYLPNYKYANDITIHQLLAHRTGIPTFDFQKKINTSKWFNSKIDIKEMVTTYCSGSLEFEPDSQMEYSNSNFIILTAIIEEIEGRDYYSVLNEFVIHPLKLESTYRPDLLPNQNVANGYILEGNNYTLEPKWEKSNMKGAGCIYSNATDLLKWINAIQLDDFLSPSDVFLIKSPISYYEYYNSDFGYSWAINKGLFRTKEPTYFYGGTSLGFFSMITTIPENGISIILLSNKGNFPRIELTNEILEVLE